MTAFFRTFFVLIASFIIFSVSIEAKPYFSERYDMNFNTLTDWDLVEERRDKSISMVNDELATTINVTGFYFEEPITANGLQIWRMTGTYDGWVNLFERPGTEEEALKANVEDAYVAVYSKHGLNSRMEVTETIAGEYYYATGNYGYAISIHTPKENWGEVQPSLKAVLESFWVGKGLRPHHKKRIKRRYGWQFPGGDFGNTSSIKAKPAINAILQSMWSETIGPVTAFSESSHPIVVDNVVVSLVGNALMAFELESGERVWGYSLPDQYNRFLGSHQGVLYLSGNEGGILAVLIENGRVLFRIRDGVQYAAPAVFDGLLYGVTKKNVSVFQSNTGDKVARINGAFDTSYFAIGNEDSVIFVKADQRLALYSSETFKPKWESGVFSNRILQPSLYNDYVIVGVEGVVNRPLEVLSLNTGQLLWTYDSSSPVRLLSPPTISDEAVIVLLRKTGLEVIDVVMALDVRSGEVIWEQQVLLPSTSFARPVVADRMVFVPVGEKGEIVSFDLVTGEQLPVRELLTESVDAKTVKSLRFYNESLIRLVSHGENLTLDVLR
jgi:outer membrane protein assembly factor BamB